MTPGQGTTRRTIRIPDELWDQAVTEAERRGEDVSVAVRRFLVAYVEHRDE